MHEEWEEFEGHEVVSIEKVEGDLTHLISPKKTFPRCPKHDENMKLYCETCGELICTHCIVHIHKDHKYCVITDTFESHKKEILDSLGPVEKQLEATDTALANLDGRHAEIVEHQGKISTNINARFDEIRRAFDAREAELMTGLEGHTQQQLKTLSDQRKDIEIFQTQCNNCLHFVRESIRTGSPGDVLKMKQGVMKQVRELVDTFDLNNLEPRETANTCFVPSVEMVKSCNEFGVMHCVNIPCKAITTEHVTAYYRFISPLNSAPPDVKLVSKITGKTTKDGVKKRRMGDYEISYQATVGGAHQLHVRVGEEDVAGSPFPVAVKTPIDKLGTVINTINDLKSPCGVAVNQAGEIIVAEYDAGIVSIFSPTGNQLRKLDTRGTAVGEMKYPQGVAVDSDDNILVVDYGKHRLLKFSSGGDLIAEIGSNGDGPGQFRDLFGMCVNIVAGNKVYVADNSAHCVHIFNSDLTFSSKFGSEGGGNGQFYSPWDIASDCSGCVYVADAGNNRVQVFTSDGGYLRQFGNEGSNDGELNDPISICVGSDDLVYVGEDEDGNGRVSVFTSEGVFLKSFGSYGSRRGQFKKPYGIAVDQCGVVYVSDYSNNRVQIFS